MVPEYWLKLTSLFSAKCIQLLKNHLIFQHDWDPCYSTCEQSGWWGSHHVKRLANPEPWLKSDEANLVRTKEKNLSEESMQSWSIVGDQAQRMASHTCEDDLYASFSKHTGGII